MLSKMLKKMAVCLAPCVALAMPMHAHAWTVKIGCEGGTLGAKVLQAVTNSFTVSGTKTIYTTEKVGSGSQACKLGIAAGSDGFPASGVEWGGMLDMPTPVSVGQQLWVRLSVYVPTTFRVETNGGVLKFLRLHTRTGSTNTGCIDLWWGVENMTFWDPDANKEVYAPMALGFEGKPQNTVVGVNPADSMVKGKWETYEIYVKVDSVAKSQGGTGEFKVWKNNKLISSMPHRISAVDKNGVIDSLLLFTYWNGNSPATQSLYVDDITLTTDAPSNRDAAGNPYIGVPVMTGTVPEAPTGLVIP